MCNTYCPSWLLILLALVLQGALVAWQGWSWPMLLWWGGLWVGTGALVGGLVWGLARLGRAR